jgi:hypothetical protein
MKRAKSKPAPSAVRQRLAELIAARDAIIPNLKRLEAQRDRLAAVQKPDGSVAAELAQLSAKESAAMAEWSKTGEGPSPISNVAKRAALERKLAASNAGAESARLVSAGILAEIDAESRRYASMAGPIQIAIVESLIAECEPEIQAFETMNAEASTRVSRIQQLGSLITDAAHAATDVEAKALLFSANTRFFDRLDKVDARRRPTEGTASEQRAQWLKLWAALDSDANAKLSDRASENPAGGHEVDIAAIIAARNSVLARKGI